MPNQSKIPNRQSKIRPKSPFGPSRGARNAPRNHSLTPTSELQNHQKPRVSHEDREFRELRVDRIDRADTRPPSSCTQSHPRDCQSKIKNRKSKINHALLNPDSWLLNPQIPRVSHEESIGAIESIDAIDRAAIRPPSSCTPNPLPESPQRSRFGDPPPPRRLTFRKSNSPAYRKAGAGEFRGTFPPAACSI
jgi:hypothetical protein